MFKKISKEEIISNKNELLYRAKLNKIESLLREQKETNGNPYTLIRDLNEVLRSE